MTTRSLILKLFLFAFLFLTLLALYKYQSSTIIQETEGSYPSALMWKSGIYQPDTRKKINEEDIEKAIGKILNQRIPMPQKDGETNDMQHFAVGDKIFKIQGIEESESIAVERNGNYFRIDRIRGALGIRWNGCEYDFVGNFDKENEANNKYKQIGTVENIGIKRDIAKDNDITSVGAEANANVFIQGSGIFSLNNTETNTAIAVQDVNGKYHRAVYVKKYR